MELSFTDPVMINSESTEECVKSIEECLSACNTDSIKRAGNLFLNSKFDLHEEYVALTKEKLSAEVSKVDFSKSVNAAGIINGWVSEKTEGSIEKIISPDILSDSTFLTLVTAILFKGKWKEKFRDYGSQGFWSISGMKQEVKMAKFMIRRGKYLFGYFKDENDTQVIDIPYQDGLKMTVIMPKGNLYEFESSLSIEKMNHYFRNVRTWHEIILKMPKFKFGVTYDLKKERLKNDGINILKVGSFVFYRNIYGLIF